MMLLTPEKSDCERNQKEIVSRDKGERREHRAINPDGRYDVRHYRLDGNLVKNQRCCDFLLLNDTIAMAYFIELKGSDIKKAVEQLLAAERMFAHELKGYLTHFRIVSSKTPTHNIEPKNYRNLKEKYGSDRVRCKSKEMIETLGKKVSIS